MITKSVVASGLGMLLVALTGCSAVSPEPVVYHGLYPSYSSATDLGESADLIAVGVVESSTTRWIDVSTSSGSDDPALDPALGAEDEPEAAVLPYTVQRFTLTRVIKGSAAVGDVIEVKQLGGDIDGKQYSEEGSTLLESGNRYALYLATYDKAPADLLNPSQAAYVQNDDGTFASLGGDNPIAAEVARILAERD